MKLALKSAIFLLAIIALYSCASENSPIENNPPVASLPELVTNLAERSLNSATSGGLIYTDGGAIITKRGVVWDVNPNPTINLTTKTVDGNGVGDFTSNLTNLLSGTTYYFRAYATNSVGTAYGNEYFFTTFSLPTIATNTIVNITKNSATTIASMVSDGMASGNGNIANRGVVWDINPNPTITLTTKTVGLPTNNPDGTLSKTFSCELTNLNQNTTYYARAYITNIDGTAYGEQQIFTTATLGIGDNYQGGIIGYFFRSGDSGYIQGQLHGLIVAPNDQGTASWACANANVSMLIGGTSEGIGSGNANTIFILNNIGCNTSGIAAQICYDLILNGYNDWYLPSFMELYKISENKTLPMNFIPAGTTPKYWWSSTGYPCPGCVDGVIRVSMFGNPNSQFGAYLSPSQIWSVRAVRTF